MLRIKWHGDRLTMFTTLSSFLHLFSFAFLFFYWNMVIFTFKVIEKFSSVYFIIMLLSISCFVWWKKSFFLFILYSYIFFLRWFHHKFQNKKLLEKQKYHGRNRNSFAQKLIQIAKRKAAIFVEQKDNFHREYMQIQFKEFWFHYHHHH